ncbi:outer membrane protein [Aestuariivirga litoralis]|nr:outer membrane beta-barrel protein [Aestuariivirga litoralis]
MKFILLAAATTLAVAAATPAAQAADPTGSYDWSGFYAGVNAGAAFNNSNVTSKVTGSAAWISDSDGSSDEQGASFTGGGMLGYNWQIDRLVLGIETDINYGGFDESHNTTYPGLIGASGAVSNNFSYQSDWFGTLRGRLGYAMDNVLIYGTGGLAYGTLETKTRFGENKSNSDWLALGWTAGGGIEYGIDKWSLGLEYLYVDLGSDSFSMSDTDYTLKNEVDYRFSVVRATAKYNF